MLTSSLKLKKNQIQTKVTTLMLFVVEISIKKTGNHFVVSSLFNAQLTQIKLVKETFNSKVNVEYYGKRAEDLMRFITF